MVDEIRAERQTAEADAGGVLQRIGQRRGDRVDRALPHPLGSERSNRVICIREIDLTPRDVGVGRDAVIAELGVDDRSGVIDYDPLVERPTNPPRYRALDLPMQSRARYRGGLVGRSTSGS